MFPRLRGAWGPRRLAFAAVPAALGALLFLAGDRPPPGTTRLEATQGGAPLPLPADPATTTVPAAPATPAAEGVPAPGGPTGLLGEAVAAAVAANPEAAAAWTPPAAATTVGSPTASATNTAPASSDSSASPRAVSGESAPAAATGAVTSTSTTAPPTTAPPTTTTTAAPRTGRLPSVEAEVVPLTNQDRNANGLGSLSRSSCLDAVAARYAEQLAGSGVLAHNPGAGAAVRDCRPNAAWGDNVGTALPCSAAVLEERWMASPSHRHNILTGEFQYVGVGAWTDSSGACWIQVLFSS